MKHPVPRSQDREKVIKETANFRENFDVYMKAIIPNCMDNNFVDEVICDKDVYFLDQSFCLTTTIFSIWHDDITSASLTVFILTMCSNNIRSNK